MIAPDPFSIVMLLRTVRAVAAFERAYAVPLPAAMPAVTRVPVSVI